MAKWYCECEAALEDIIVDADYGNEAEDIASERFVELLQQGDIEITCTCDEEEA